MTTTAAVEATQQAELSTCQHIGTRGRKSTNSAAARRLEAVEAMPVQPKLLASGTELVAGGIVMPADKSLCLPSATAAGTAGGTNLSDMEDFTFVEQAGVSMARTCRGAGLLVPRGL